ncbi:MAG: Na+/H+ antiporter subunit D, partial [Actinomycetota bacterium]
MTSLIALPVLVPLIAAAVMLIARHRLIQRVISLAALVASLVVSITVLVDLWTDGPVKVVRLGGWPGEFAITMVADRLASVMVVVALVVVTAVLVYAMVQGGADEKSSFY